MLDRIKEQMMQMAAEAADEAMYISEDDPKYWEMIEDDDFDKEYDKAYDIALTDIFNELKNELGLQ